MRNDRGCSTSNGTRHGARMDSTATSSWFASRREFRLGSSDLLPGETPFPTCRRRFLNREPAFLFIGCSHFTSAAGGRGARIARRAAIRLLRRDPRRHGGLRRQGGRFHVEGAEEAERASVPAPPNPSTRPPAPRVVRSSRSVPSLRPVASPSPSSPDVGTDPRLSTPARHRRLACSRAFSATNTRRRPNFSRRRATTTSSQRRGARRPRGLSSSRTAISSPTRNTTPPPRASRLPMRTRR